MLNMYKVNAKQVHISSLKGPSKFRTKTTVNCDGPGRYAMQGGIMKHRC